MNLKQFFLLMLMGVSYSAFALELVEVHSDAEISTATLLADLQNTKALASEPEAPYTLHQASSYSRNAKAKGQPGWFCNADASQYVRTEINEGRSEHVLMDVDGAGAIVRFWSTFHAEVFSNGILRFYFDGSDKAEIEAPIREILGGNFLVDAPLSQSVSPFFEKGKQFSGQNLYLPIPFAKKCKITYQELDKKRKDTLYYQINYRKYKNNPSIKTFSMQDLKSFDFKTISETISPINLGQKSVYTINESQMALSAINLKLKKVKNYDEVLRKLLLKIQFDGKTRVHLPIGDFFGTGYKYAPYKSKMCEVRNDGTLLSNFIMPFKNQTRITIENISDEPIDYELEIAKTPWTWNGESYYFNATSQSRRSPKGL